VFRLRRKINSSILQKEELLLWIINNPFIVLHLSLIMSPFSLKKLQKHSLKEKTIEIEGGSYEMDKE